MQIEFHGADRNVTGSCHLLRCCDKTILIDCGLYQGSHELTEENQAPFGFDAASVDYLLLTHAHLDHCGRIPLLMKRGFQGEIITTAATRELAKLVMLDAASLQEEDARWQNKKAARKGKHHKPVEPLYTTLDALEALDYFGRTATYGNTLQLGKHINIRFHDAGHILGSASIEINVSEQGQHKRILFSGDIGYTGRVILRDPETPTDVDILVMETTYGDRLHKSLEPSIEELYDAITSTFKRGGNVIIPTFALERAQEVLYYLRQGIETSRLPASTQVFLDSPMAISATEIFRRHPECYDEDACDLFTNGTDPFELPGLHFTRETAESMALNNLQGGAVIMAGSGMCTGGRVRHHLKHNIWRRDSSIVFVGYAAIGTPARRIIDGAKSIRLFGEEIPVEAQIYTIGGFSAHADQKDLLAWHNRVGKPAKTFLVHGDEDAMRSFAKHLPEHDVILPELGDSYDL